MSEEVDAGLLNNTKQLSVLAGRTTSSPLFRRNEGQRGWRPWASITHNSLFSPSKLEFLSRGSQPIPEVKGNIH